MSKALVAFFSASGVTEKLFDMYNVSVVCSDGSTVWNGQLGTNPAYGV